MEIKIQLGQFKNVNSVNQDMTVTLPLTSPKNVIMEYDLKNILDVTTVYEIERQDIDTFRMYGEIEYLSPLNAMITGYTSVTDFFTVFSPSAITKNVISDFKFYLLAPETGYTALVTGSTGGTFLKNYEVMSQLSNFEIYNSGYGLNVFGEQQHAWNFNVDFDIKSRYDGLNFPLDKLYLYAQYQPQLNGGGDAESISGLTYDAYGNTGITDITNWVTGTTLTTGSTVTGDTIEWNKQRYTQETITKQEYYIRTPYSADTLALIWRYSPIIPITLRVFEDDLQKANISGTSYEDVTSIPIYATKLDDGNYVWRNLLDKGFIDPLTGIGVNYPFVNQKQYIFNNIVVAVKPDLEDTNTATVFDEIKFGVDTFISAQPNSNLENIGKPCNI